MARSVWSAPYSGAFASRRAELSHSAGIRRTPNASRLRACLKNHFLIFLNPWTADVQGGFRIWRMQKTTLYPTDLTDEQWNLLQLALPPRKPRKGRKRRGRPPADLRRVCSALLYFVRSGCAWRLLPR